MLLYAARERVQVARPRVRRERPPRGERRTCCRHSSADVCGSTVRDARDDLVGRWIDYVEQRARLCEDAADVVPECAMMTREPGERLLVALRRRAVLHRFEDLRYSCHCVLIGHPKRRRGIRTSPLSTCG